MPQQPQRRHNQLIRITSFGNSMLPILHDGDTLFLQKTSFKRLNTNDIISFYKNRSIISHRIIYKATTYVVTKGDGNLYADGKIMPQQILGKVVKIQRDGNIIHPETIYLLQSASYFEEIVKITDLFHKNNITFVYLKGLPLHLYFEKAHPQRIYADCDVLIDKKQYAKVARLLSKYGYKKSTNAFSKIQQRLKDKETEISFVKRSGGSTIIFDVHLEPVFMMVQLGTLEALYPQRKINELTTDFLEARQIVTIQGFKMPILSPAHLLLYLALHFFHDNYKGYYKAQFLAKVLTYYDQKSTHLLLIGMIKYFNLQNFVYPSFYFVKKYYYHQLPDWFLKHLKPRAKIMAYIRHNILSTSIFNELSRGAAGIIRFRLLFHLSPNPLYKKLFVFLNLQVVFALAWVFQKKIGFILKR